MPFLLFLFCRCSCFRLCHGCVSGFGSRLSLRAVGGHPAGGLKGPLSFHLRRAPPSIGCASPLRSSARSTCFKASKVAQHASPTDTNGDPGELRSRPKVAKIVGQRLSKRCPGAEHVLRQVLADRGQLWPKLDPVRPNSGANSGKTWPILASSDHKWPKFAGFGRRRPKLGRNLPTLFEHWPNLAQTGQTVAQNSQFGRRLPDARLLGHLFNVFWTSVWQLSNNCGARRHRPV